MVNVSRSISSRVVLSMLALVFAVVAPVVGSITVIESDFTTSVYDSSLDFGCGDSAYAIYVDPGAILNLYGGTVSFLVDNSTGGTANVYGSDFMIGGAPVVEGEYIMGGEMLSWTGGGCASSMPVSGTVNLNASTSGSPEIEVYPLAGAHDYGNIGIGEPVTYLVQIFNFGTADLSVDSVTLSDSPAFTITGDPIAPFVLAQSTPGTAVGVDIEVVFTPSVTGYAEATLTITSDDGNESTVEIILSGIGVDVPVPPAEQIQAIVVYFDESVADGTLVGDGPGNSASKRLKALGNMIESAGDLINDGEFGLAIQQLESIAKKTDGVNRPPDFVTGSAVPVLNGMINDLIASL